jgi:hypothetical protein
VKQAGQFQPFNPVVYSLDTLLPLVNFQQKTFWEPNGPHASAVRGYLWAHVAMGWLLATTLIATLPMALQRRTAATVPL